MDSFVKMFTKILMKKIKISFIEFDFGIDQKFIEKEISKQSLDLSTEIEEFILSYN